MDDNTSSISKGAMIGDKRAGPENERIAPQRSRDIAGRNAISSTPSAPVGPLTSSGDFKTKAVPNPMGRAAHLGGLFIFNWNALGGQGVIKDPEPVF